MALTRIIPVPRCVAFGGRDRLVGELRLEDVALLEAWVEARTPYPGDGLPPRGSPGVDAAEWQRRFEAAWDAAEAWPPAYGEAHSNALYATTDGLAFFAWVALRREEPGLTLAEARDAALSASSGEWATLSRVAFAADPLDALDALLPDPAAPDAGSPIRWEEEVYRVAEALGQSFEAVGRMTLGQFDAARRGGRPKQRGIAIDDGMSPEEAATLNERQRRRFYGEDD